MIAKYNVFLRERPICMKHNQRTGRCVVGGHPESLIEMQSLITDYFERKTTPRPRYPARNKVRMEFDLSFKKWTEGIRAMAEHGIRVSPTKTHGRQMR